MKITELYLKFKARNKKVILVDFFDTIVFREVHSWQIPLQWERMMRWRFPALRKLSMNVLIKIRNKAASELHSHFDEPPYKEVIRRVYEYVPTNVSFDEFYNASLKIDTAIELGVQYINPTIRNFLYSEKAKGKKIILVSDFYLPKEVYNQFLENAGIKDLFDKVFVSEDCNRTKLNGNIYPYVLNELNVSPDDCIMIGDQTVSDVKNTNKYGIAAVRYFPIIHKIKTNIRRIRKIDYSNIILNRMGNRLHRESLLGEYALPLMLFERKLLETIKAENVSNIAFFSRGGYLLKSLFDELLTFNGIKQVKTSYCYISRKTVYNAKEDENAKKILLEYLSQFMDGEVLHFVDEGWYCHSQQVLRMIFGITTDGLYLGVRGRDKIVHDEDCRRRGLLFDINDGKNKSKFYGELCTNCSLYEQMLTAPEGSTIGYHYEGDRIVTDLKYNDVEREAYSKYIHDWQQRLTLSFRGLLGWLADKDIDEKQVANVILKTDLWNNKARCKFMNNLDASMVDNMGGTKQAAKTIKDVHVNIFDILRHPSDYLNQMCKLQRKIYRNPIINLCYGVIAWGYYLYVKIMRGGFISNLPK